MAEAAAAYGSGDTQICRHSAQDRRRSDSDTDALCSWAWKWMRCADRAFRWTCDRSFARANRKIERTREALV